MAETQLNVSLPELRKTVKSWLESQLDEEAYNWLSETTDKFLDGVEDWQFFSSFSAVPQYTSKDELTLSEEQQQKAGEMRSGWRPDRWRVDQVGRTLLLLCAADTDKSIFLDRLDKTFVSSDMEEAVALYQALPVLPYPEQLTDRGAEGLRSNMTSVFNAVALHNPYPAEYFDQGAWNQLVLKALFVGSPLYKIQGLDNRRNRKLAEMLVDYAHERWAADRSVSPELWRPVGPFVNEDMIEDLKKVLDHSDPVQQKAAVLALSESSDKKAQLLLEEHKTTWNQVKDNNITWDYIGNQSDDYR